MISNWWDIVWFLNLGIIENYWEFCSFWHPISTPKFAAKKNWRAHLTSGHVVPWPSVCSQKQKKVLVPKFLENVFHMQNFGQTRVFRGSACPFCGRRVDLPGEREERHPGRDGGGGAAWGWCLGALDPRWVSRKNIGCEWGNQVMSTADE